MSEEKRIEKIAKDLGDTWVCDLEGNPHDLSEVLMQCDIEQIAEQMHGIGYRKASELAEEIFAEIKNLLLPIVYLGADGNWHITKPYASNIHSFVEGFLDLLEKYTEGK